MKVHVQSLFIGFVAGAAVAAAAPVVLPALSEALRPAAKVLLKQGLLGIERARMTVARAAESVEDLIAEVRAEVEAQLAPKAAVKRNGAAEVVTVNAPRSSASMPS